MKPVDQTRFSPCEKPYGNCFAACIASIFEVSLQEVLDDSQIEAGGPWWIAWKTWLEQSGYGLIHLNNDPPAWFFPIKGYVILSGKSPRGDFEHSVVALDGKMVHDPHPSRAGIESVIDWVVLYPRDPARDTRVGRYQ